MPKPLSKSTKKRTITAADVGGPPTADSLPTPEEPVRSGQHEARKRRRRTPRCSVVTPTESDGTRTVCLRSVAPCVRISDFVQQLGDHGTIEAITFVPGDTDWPWRIRFETPVEVQRALAAVRQFGSRLQARPATNDAFRHGPTDAAAVQQKKGRNDRPNAPLATPHSSIALHT
eukprot:GGOE01000688.1.p1 GENE.GGOE01000688.1~~GGOE01000688.1.p1  ORF type:complete len:174 (-),score=13.05 GGOE01000688.1:83-604(-)